LFNSDSQASNSKHNLIYTVYTSFPLGSALIRKRMMQRVCNKSKITLVVFSECFNFFKSMVRDSQPGKIPCKEEVGFAALVHVKAKKIARRCAKQLSYKKKSQLADTQALCRSV
jgi:hypothetical protein